MQGGRSSQIHEDSLRTIGSGCSQRQMVSAKIGSKLDVERVSLTGLSGILRTEKTELAVTYSLDCGYVDACDFRRQFARPFNGDIWLHVQRQVAKVIDPRLDLQQIGFARRSIRDSGECVEQIRAAGCRS